MHYLRRLVFSLGVGAVVGACSDAGTSTSDHAQTSSDREQTSRRQESLISDQFRDGGTVGFYFLPPISDMPNEFGDFVPQATPSVSIDEIDEIDSHVLRHIATYTTTSGPGGERVTVPMVFGAERYYLVRFHTDSFDLSDAATYRLTVSVPGRELGFADVDIVRSWSEYTNVNRDEHVPVFDGGTLGIRFRIDRPAVDGDLDGVLDWLDICPENPDPEQRDTDQDGIGDACECSSDTCQPLDQCHDAGDCDPATGTCSNPAKPNDSPCDDANVCTQSDTCQAGACTGANPVQCAAPDQCHVAGACDPATGTCSNTAKPNSSPCDDGNACTGNDTCQAGACTGGNPVQCGAPDQCHEAGVCDPATGTCSNPAKQDGSACDDGSACTQGDTCQAGACAGGNPVQCAAPDQCHEAGVCDPATGTCSNPSKQDGSACDDSSACTQSDTCQAGACTGGNPVACTALDQCHVAGACDPATGTCSNPAKQDGSACDDGSACTQSDACQAGACAGGNPVQCAAPDECHEPGVCDPATGTCSNPSKQDGTSCDDGSACTQTDTCQAGACTGGSPVQCAAPDQCHEAGVCDPATGTCSNPAKQDGSACDDGSACTQTDTCQAGACTGANPIQCAAPDQCHEAGVCDPATGTCSNPAKQDGTVCDDGSACTQTDTCQAGACTGGNPVQCAAPDQCHEAGVCDPATGTCSNPAKQDGTACDDGSGCTQSDTCQAGSCTGANPVECAALDECHDPGICDPATGTCSNPAKQDGSACDDGSACTQTDTCQAGACSGVNPVHCTPLDQCHGAGVCDPATGTCSNPTKPNGTACSDGNACTQSDTCEAGSCAGTNPVQCSALDQCHNAGVCDPATGTCSNPAKQDGTGCNDGSACTQTDICEAGTCTGNNPIECPALDQCHDPGLCDPQTGFCSTPSKSDGASCDDGNACTQTDTCQSGGCIGGNPVQCSGSCNPQTGVCTPSGPPISIGDLTLGKDLQSSLSVSLGAPAPAGGAQVTLASADPSRVLLSSSATAVGSGELVVNIPAGGTNTSFTVQALADSGAVQLSASAPSFSPDTGTVTLVPSGFFFQSPGNFTTTTFSVNTLIDVRSARLNPTTLAVVAGQPLRAGATASVDIINTNPLVGAITVSPLVFQGDVSSRSSAFDPVTAGTTQISLGTPNGFSRPSSLFQFTATVTAPPVTLGDVTVGKDLQSSLSVSLGAPAPAGGAQVTLASADPSRVLLSSSATAVGSGELVVNIPAGGTNASFTVQALADSGAVQLSASAPSFSPDTGTVTLVPSGFFFQSPGNFTTTTFSVNTLIDVRSARLNPTTLAVVAGQPLRAGATASVDIINTNPLVGAITVSPLVFQGDVSSRSSAFDPVTAGTTQISLGTPNGFSRPSSLFQFTATVTAPPVTLGDVTVGKDLQSSLSVSLGAPAPAGGAQVTLASADPSRVLLSSSATAVGSGELVVNIPAGGTNASFTVQALADSAAVQLSASAPSFSPDTGTVTLVPSGFFFQSPGNFTTTTFAANTRIDIRSARLNPTTLAVVAGQPVRAGVTVSVDIVSTNPTVGGITVSPLVYHGSESSLFTAFDPATFGTAEIAVVTPSGFSTPLNQIQITATVRAPKILFNPTSIRVGRDLQRSVAVSLEAAPPDPASVVIESGAVSMATLTTNPLLEGSVSVTFTNVTGTSVGSFFVQGRELGSTALFAQAAGYEPSLAALEIDPSGFSFANPNNFTTSAAAPNTPITVSSTRLDPGSLNFAATEPLRGGILPVSVQLMSSNPLVGSITTDLLLFGANVSQVTTAFDPLAVGSSTLSVLTPAGFATSSNRAVLLATVN